MPGNSGVTVQSGLIPLARYADKLAVFRLHVQDDTSASVGQYYYLEPMPNIVCTAITIRKCAHWPTATFRYIFTTDLEPAQYPSRFNQVYGNITGTNGIVQIDDRLVVIRYYSDGNWSYMFDGFVTSPQVVVSGNQESAIIAAQGTPIREWDYVLTGALWSAETTSSDATWSTDPSGVYSVITPAYFTENTARFNPLGKANASAAPDDEDINIGWFGPTYFTDTLFKAFVSQASSGYYSSWGYASIEIPGPLIPSWTVAQAAMYIVGMGIEWPFGFNSQGKNYRPAWMKSSGTPYVSVYDINNWATLLQSYVPKTKAGPINLSDASTFTSEDITCPDLEVTGDAWPHALEKLITPYGFEFRFDLRKNNSSGPQAGMPEWYLTLYRIDDPTYQTQLMMQNAGGTYNPALTNVGGLHLGREAVGIANEFEVDCALVEYEATFVLAPAFPIADGDIADLEQWKLPMEDNTKKDYYRKFVFGEGGVPCLPGTASDTGTGMNYETALQQADCTLVDKVLDVLLDNNSPSRGKNARKNRRPYGHLISKEPDGRPWQAQLYVNTCGQDQGSWRYGTPAVWDGSLVSPGTWQRVSATNWHILPDCIGIMLTCQDPNGWMAGKPKEGQTAVWDAEGQVSLVEGLQGQGSTPWPILALTCCIFADEDVFALAPKRAASTTAFTIRRKVDRRDQYKKQILTQFSMVAVEQSPGLADPGNGWSASRDDTNAAQYAADQYRRAHECGAHAGTVEIPRITNAYNVGQSITQITGRNVDLTLNSGDSSGETALYPRIASITWDLATSQKTIINLTDERADPATHRSIVRLHQHVVRHRH